MFATAYKIHDFLYVFVLRYLVFITIKLFSYRE